MTTERRSAGSFATRQRSFFVTNTRSTCICMKAYFPLEGPIEMAVIIQLKSAKGW